MLSNKKIGYTRVSTAKQENENQIKIIKEFLNEDIEFVNEIISSGKKLKDRELFNLINRVESGTTIYITSLDRLARNVMETLEILEICKEKDITIFIVKIGLKLSKNITPMDNMFVQILSMVAEMERQTIKDRINDGLKRTKKKSGRRKGQKIKSKLDKFKNEIIEYNKKDLTPKSIKKLLSDRIEISEMQIYRFLKKIKNEE
jgi:DNA invertase Pin-like site-specific DNA recombinase